MFERNTMLRIMFYVLD